MTEQKFTLTQAEIELRRRKCSYEGHDYQVLTSLGNLDPETVLCMRCGKSWPIAAASAEESAEETL